MKSKKKKENRNNRKRKRKKENVKEPPSGPRPSYPPLPRRVCGANAAPTRSANRSTPPQCFGFGKEFKRELGPFTGTFVLYGSRTFFLFAENGSRTC
jgi:hypothetical protein